MLRAPHGRIPRASAWGSGGFGNIGHAPSDRLTMDIRHELPLSPVFAAGLFSLAVGIMRWMMAGRSVHQREGRGLAIFQSVFAGRSGGSHGRSQIADAQIALMGNAVNSSPS